MMSNSYVWQKIFQATESLVGSRPIQERLEFAAQSLILLKRQELPETLKNDFEELINDLTKVEPIGNEGKIKATVMKYSDDEAEAIARKILSMYDRVTRLQKPRT